MSYLKTLRVSLTVFAAVLVGSLLALLFYYYTQAFLPGPYTLTREFIASFVALIVWVTSAFWVGSFIEKQTSNK